METEMEDRQGRPNIHIIGDFEEVKINISNI